MTTWAEKDSTMIALKNRMEPSIFFKSVIDDMEPGKVLLPGEGDGRNAVYAASCGWDVTAFDQSEAEMTKALLLANEKGVNVNYLIADAMEFSSIKKFHAIASIGLHLPASVRHAFHRLLQQWLKPGGKIILEGFSSKQGAVKVLNETIEESMLFDEASLRRDFDYLDIEHLEELEVKLNEGTPQEQKVQVIRLIGTME